MISFLEYAIPILIIIFSLVFIVWLFRYKPSDYLNQRLMIIGFPVFLVFAIIFIIIAISMLSFGHWIGG
jgi:hypothetical protein